MRRHFFACALALVFALAAFCPVSATAARDFTAASEMIQSNNDAGRAWAVYIVRAAGARTDAEKIRAVCTWYAENMEYDYETAVRVRKLAQTEHALNMPRHDYLSVLTVVTAYVTGKSDKKPKSLCGGYVYGSVGSLRALGIPAQVRIGTIERSVRKGESYFDAAGVQRVSAGGGETPYNRVNGRWVKVTDLHARVAAFAADEKRWILVDPTFLSLVSGDAYLDMNEADYARRWKDLYVSAERTPRAWKEDPLPAPTLVQQAPRLLLKDLNDLNQNYSYVTTQTQIILKNFILVIASKAKQSSIRMSTGLLRSARNDDKRDSPQ